MKVKRSGKFKIKKSHPDYNLVKLHTIEAKEIYNYANYIIRQIYFKKSGKLKYSMKFINEYPVLSNDFNIYLNEEFQFTSTFYKLFAILLGLKNIPLILKWYKMWLIFLKGIGHHIGNY